MISRRALVGAGLLALLTDTFLPRAGRAFAFAVTLGGVIVAAWLALLAAGVWLFVWMQASTTGAGYVGTQAHMVYIVTLVQGQGPPESLLPGIDRFAGITLGVVTLLLVTALLRPIGDARGGR